MVRRMKHKSVPQTKPIQQEFPFHLVKVDPELQPEVAQHTPAQRRELAFIFLKYAHQLLVTAEVLERHAEPWQRRALPRVPPRVLARN